MDMQKDWFKWCGKEGTSGDQVFDILEDWRKDREQLLHDWEVGRNILTSRIKELVEEKEKLMIEIEELKETIEFNRKGIDRWEYNVMESDLKYLNMIVIIFVWVVGIMLIIASSMLIKTLLGI